MCGIYGAVGCGLDEAATRRALERLAHRGPDGRDVLVDRERDVAFGHARLSIIDLSDAGRQPMTNEDGTVRLVLNGEIYNHEVLRAELEAKGHRFKGRCDAEVVVHLWEEEGEALLDRLTGMFAFALFDTRSGLLFAARDRLGIKPLFTYADGSRFAFASEPKALLATPGLDLAPDVTAYFDFLTYNHVPAPKTVWKRIRKLPAGHCLTVEVKDGRASEPRVRRWWDVTFAPDERYDAERAFEEFVPLLRTVVRDHLLADVPVGAFLSGGLDSTLVAATASVEGSAPDAFTIRFPRGKHDESAVAATNAARFGLKHTIGDFDADELLPRLARARELFDEPFGDHSFLPTLAVSELARATHKVVLSGDGGDETHLGYGRYTKAQRRRVGNAVGDVLAFAGPLVRATALVRVAPLRHAVEGRLGRTCHWYGGLPRETKRLFVTPTCAELRDYDDYWLYREHARDDLSPLARQQYLDFKTTLPEAILTKVDRTSMAVGLEVRPPLLDHRLVEFAGRLPDELKLRDREGKVLLRRALAERIAPEATAGPKRGFSLPLERFVREDGMFRITGDVDVLGAFTIDAKRLNEVFTPARDAQKLWLVHQLAAFASC